MFDNRPLNRHLDGGADGARPTFLYPAHHAPADDHEETNVAQLQTKLCQQCMMMAIHEERYCSMSSVWTCGKLLLMRCATRYAFV
mmetsp:Transcript_21499/g.41058  ORF Transcript_21499/g.41058 Transcript_21499/m.41058 type:complete len:85 (-) Transcript_21499:126-380(-)